MPPPSIEAARRALADAANQFTALAGTPQQDAGEVRSAATQALDQADAALGAAGGTDDKRSQARAALEGARTALARTGSDSESRQAVASSLQEADRQLAAYLGDAPEAAVAAAESAEAVAPVMGDVGVRPEEADQAALATDRANDEVPGAGAAQIPPTPGQTGSAAQDAAPPAGTQAEDRPAQAEQMLEPQPETALGQSGADATGPSVATTAPVPSADAGVGSLLGRPLRDSAGQQVGTVEDLLLDPATGGISHVVVALMQDGRQVLLPWAALDRSHGDLTSRQTAEQLQTAEAYRPESGSDPMVGQGVPQQ